LSEVGDAKAQASIILKKTNNKNKVLAFAKIIISTGVRTAVFLFGMSVGYYIGITLFVEEWL
jgi:hypothetical protein